MRFHHVAFRTFDLERLEAFYERVLGLPVIQRRPGSVWLDCAGTVLMLESAKTGEPPLAPGSLDLVAFTIDEAERAAMEAE